MRKQDNIKINGENTMELYLDNGYDEFEIEVSFDYQPYEAMTRHYPGCNEQAEIYEIKRADNGAELCLIDQDTEIELSEKILEELHQEADEREIDRYEWNLY